MELRTTAEPLECMVSDFSHLQRRVGVIVGTELGPGEHAGLDGEPCVELHYETVTVNTAQFGSYVRMSEAAERYRLHHGMVIQRLDEVITELTAHRDRLAAIVRQA